MSKVNKVALAALVSLAPMATAQASAPAATPQAAMTQFCQDLEQYDFETANFNMRGIETAELEFMGAEQLTLLEAGLQMENELTRLGRCEVLGGTGNAVQLRVSRPNHAKLKSWLDSAEAEKAFDDPELNALLDDVLQLLESDVDAPLEGLIFITKSSQLTNALYQKSLLSLDQIQLTTRLENDYGRWTFADGEIELLALALAGKTDQ